MDIVYSMCIIMKIRIYIYIYVYVRNMYIYIYFYTHTFLDGQQTKLFTKFNAMHKFGRPLVVVRISVLSKESQMGYRYRRFCAASERPRRSKTKLVLQIILSVTYMDMQM